MKISVIVPYYNQKEYLPITLDSLATQDYRDFEVIVIDDHSFRKQRVGYINHPGIPKARLLTNEHNMGTAKTLNKAFRLAKGDYLTYLASDNVLWRSCLDALYNAIIKRKVDIVYASYTRMTDDGQYIDQCIWPNAYENLEQCYQIGMCFLISRSAWEKVGEFNEDIKCAHDWDWFLRAKKLGLKFSYVSAEAYNSKNGRMEPQPLGAYRSHEGRKDQGNWKFYKNGQHEKDKQLMFKEELEI